MEAGVGWGPPTTAAGDARNETSFDRGGPDIAVPGVDESQAISERMSAPWFGIIAAAGLALMLFCRAAAKHVRPNRKVVQIRDDDVESPAHQAA